jgi:type IV pilus assembly protein PilA
LLIVVAILGVLAAVVIPNVGRFIGRGETEAGKTELTNIQSAVIAMMTDNQVSVLPHPVLVATNDMAAFPDATSACATVGEKVNDPSGTAYTASDKDGFILYGHDITSDAAETPVVNYVATQLTKGTYIVDANGTVAQATTGYE